MKTILKPKDRDLVILNLTDIHLGNDDSSDPSLRRIFAHTLHTLVERIHPDLITSTGDLCWGGHHEAQADLLCEMHQIGIPYAFALGNHDHDADARQLAAFEEMLTADPLSLYEPGDPALGNGNYALLIAEETGAPCLGLIFADTHNRVFLPHRGDHFFDKLSPAQLDWYGSQVEELKRQGCPSSALFLHTPPYAYRLAYQAAFVPHYGALSFEEKNAPHGGVAALLQDGYKNVIGTQNEGICSYPEDDGVLDALHAHAHTTHVFAGHDHTNTWSIPYEGITFTYCVKLGKTAYWDSRVNGGTVITVGQTGITSVRQEYVEAD